MLQIVWLITILSGNFQLSPDFRQRASSNASSVGRLSPIPSIAPDEWNYTTPLTDFILENENDDNGDTTEPNEQQMQQLEDLAGVLADELKLQQSEFLQGSVSNTIYIINPFILYLFIINMYINIVHY